MKIMIIGVGLMGPAAAYNCAIDPEVTAVTVCDSDQGQLDACAAKLEALGAGRKVRAVRHDLRDHDASVSLIGEHDAVVTALPWRASMLALRAAMAARVPIVDLAIPDEADRLALRLEADASGILVLLGCGLEPGLTEILARHLASQMDEVSELRIHCGGIPEVPAGPLGYKIVFGGRQLPLRQIPALVVEDGVPMLVPRYSETEPILFEGVGECESWNEGVIPWLLDLPELETLRSARQKTVRWPGYAAKATMLNELGLLETEPVDVDGHPVAPKRLVDEVLFPHVRLEPGEHDITVVRVEVAGTLRGEPLTLRADLIDRYDERLGFTSMARTTAFTGAIAARMIARGEVTATGLQTPDWIFVGHLFDRMMEELASCDIRFGYYRNGEPV